MNSDLNLCFANAIRAYRLGKRKPITMSPAASGRLFHDLAQRLIRQRLSDSDYRHYCRTRDLSRRAVKVLHMGDYTAARQYFRQVDDYLSQHRISGEVERLSRSWQHQGEAYLETKLKNWQQARAQLQNAMSCDYELEKNYNYALFHAARIHVIHLALRIEAGAGESAYAIDLAQHIAEYLLGFRSELPIGEGWSSTLAKTIPQALRDALLARVAGEVGSILSSQPISLQSRLFTRFPAWASLQNHSLLAEIYDWGLAKQVFLQGDTPLFLERAASLMILGRRETTLWYGTVLDLLCSCQTLRSEQTQSFRHEIIDDVRKWQSLPAELFPRALIRRFAEAETQPDNYRHITPKRQFQAYTVGLPRTGTTSIYALFKNYRSGNEYMEQETIRRIVARHDGLLSLNAFGDFLARRDKEGGLEMDSASFNHFYLDLLVETYPHAKFIFMIREPYSWMNSYLKMLMRWRQGFEERNRNIPQWMTDYGRILFGDFSWSMISSAVAVKQHIEPLADGFLRHWCTANQRIIDLLPPERSLIIKTHELSSQRHLIADFTQIPQKRLTNDHHVNASPNQHDLFEGLPAAIFDDRIAMHGAQILNKFFHTV